MSAAGSIEPAVAEPDHDCPLCPRLVAFRETHRAREPNWFNAPVPTFGPDDAELLIVGLAPGLRGANRTGRPSPAIMRRPALPDADRPRARARHLPADPNDGLELVGAAITNGVRCVPPDNKPIGAEISACRPFLAATISRFTRLKAIVVLGRIAHDTTLSALGARRASHPFRHGAEHSMPGGRTLFDSYHCSRYNTNTGVLTPPCSRRCSTGWSRISGGEPPPLSRRRSL